MKTMSIKAESIPQLNNNNDINTNIKTEIQKINMNTEILNKNNAPKNILYNKSNMIFLVNSKIYPEIKPTIIPNNIPKCKFKIEPLNKLPNGIQFDLDSGIIRGYPIELCNTNLFKITAKNEFGEANVTINICVINETNIKNELIGFSFNKSNIKKIKKVHKIDENEIKYNTKEEREAAFFALLANKGVTVKTNWDPIFISSILNDLRFNAFNTNLERKIAFKKYKKELINSSGNKELIEFEKQKEKKLIENFKLLLKVLYLFI